MPPAQAALTEALGLLPPGGPSLPSFRPLFCVPSVPFLVFPHLILDLMTFFKHHLLSFIGLFYQRSH